MMVGLPVEGGKGEYDSHNLLSTYADALKMACICSDSIDGIFTLLPWYYLLSSPLAFGVGDSNLIVPFKISRVSFMFGTCYLELLFV